MRSLLILLLFTNVMLYSQSVVIENFSPEEIKANFRNKEKDFFVYVTKSSSATEGFGDKNSLSGILYWKVYGSDKIEKFEYGTQILKEDFDEISFIYLGDKQWVINIYKCKKYRPVSQITIVGNKKVIVPIETQYCIENKTATTLEITVLVDEFSPLRLGRANSTCNGNLAYYSRPNKSKKVIYQISGKDKKYEDLVIDFKELDVSKIKCFDAVIISEKQLELKVYNDYPSNSEVVAIFTKIYDLKIIEQPATKPEEQKK